MASLKDVERSSVRVSALSGTPLEHLAFVDGLRALAIVAVIVHHATFDIVSRPHWIDSGARGVNLFFEISGFCLAYPFLARARAGDGDRFDLATYVRFMARRVSRVAPAYYGALALFSVLALTPFGFPDAGHLETSRESAVRQFLLDLAFLTGKLPIHNASFWTLGIEMRWYALSPLLIALYLRSRAAFCAVGVVLYGLYFFSPWSIADEGTLPGFMLGIVAADIYLTGYRIRHFAFVPAAILIAIGVSTEAPSRSLDLASPVWQFASFFLVLAASDGIGKSIMSWKPMVWFGVCSYSVYLIHGPIIRNLTDSGLHPLPAALAGVAIAIAFYYTIERRWATRRVRERIESAIMVLTNMPHLSGKFMKR